MPAAGTELGIISVVFIRIKYISASSLLEFVPEIKTRREKVNAARAKEIGNIFQHTRRTPPMVIGKPSKL